MLLPPVLTKVIVNGVTDEHNAAHEAMERRFDLGGTPNVYNLRECGGDHTGVVDSSSLWNFLYAAGAREFYVSAGRFKVTLGSVILGSDVTITGPGTVFTSESETVGGLITLPAGSEHCTVNGPIFESPDDSAVAVVIESAASSMSKDIEVRNIRCKEARAVITNDDTIAYADHSTDDVTGTVTRDVRIINCRGWRTAPNLTDKAFVLIWYTIGATVTGCTINGYGYGIQWWGGDANPVDGDGDLANERKCGEITIAGANRVKGMLDVFGAGAGIWGSMGFGITVTGNFVDDCADVGIDFEGCDGWTASGNTVTNCVNGCLTTFFYNRNGEFGPNTCVQDDAAATPIIARVQNNFPTADNAGVTFTGGTFTCKSGIARIACETADRIIFNGITGTNVKIESNTNNTRTTTINGGSLLFTEVAASAFDAVILGHHHLGGVATVRGMTIETRVDQPAGSRAIRTYQDDPTHDVLEFIDDNVLIRWPDPIETEWDGANAGFTARTFIRRNTIDAGAAITNTRGAASLATGVAATIVKEGNYYANGTAVP